MNLTQKIISLEITCLTIHPGEVTFLDNENQVLRSKHRRIVPNIYKYQKDEVITLINDSPDSELDMSKSVVRWLIRELVKNTKFFFQSLCLTYRYELEVSGSHSLPINVVGKDGQKIWINRNATREGVAPSDLESVRPRVR